MDKNNILNLLENIPNSSKNEIFETIITNDNIKIERIISYGQTTPEDFWYDQNENEFVVVLKGKAIIKYDNNKVFKLKEGDSLFIPSKQKHKVIYTSNPTIWLSIFVTN